MAQRSGLSHTTVSRIWFALQPHRTETFKLSADPYPEKVASSSTLIHRTGRWSLPDSGPGPHQAAVAPRSGEVERLHRLRAPRHHALFAALDAKRQGDGQLPPPPPGRGVPQVTDRSTNYDPQDGADPELVCQAAPLQPTSAS